MRKLLFSLLGILFFCAQLLAQNRTVTGKVADDNSQPVVGASVIIKGTRTGTVTDSKGDFTLNIPSNAKTLVITGVGFVSHELAIGSETNFTVVLKQDA